MDDPFYEVRGDTFTVEKVFRSTRLRNDALPDFRERKQHHEQEVPEHRKLREYLRTLSRAAKASNEKLAKTGSRYRFCVYEEKGSVMIDLVILDEHGKIAAEVRRNITDVDFDRVIENISTIEGLLIDKNG